MILLVTPSERASECVSALHTATDEKVEVAESLARATTLLRAQSYVAVVLDQHLLETEPHEAEVALGHVGMAIAVHVNLAISSVVRVVREVRTAIQRRQREEVGAREAVICKLQNELNGTVTALLLSSELALKTAGLPPDAAEKLQSVHELVLKFRAQLENSMR